MRYFLERVKEAVLHRRSVAHQFVKFCIVGTFNTGVDFAIYLLLTRLSDFWMENLVLAAVVSYSCGAVSSFILNNFWTFRRDTKKMRSKSLKFIAVTAGGMILNATILYSLVSVDVYDVIAKVFATACVIAWNFTLFKYWAFKR
ncbi:MAG: GtrA family protein [Patescibacteria group bacterium]|nr:GtrA family protein [Patescibacteria group bacterium]